MRCGLRLKPPMPGHSRDQVLLSVGSSGIRYFQQTIELDPGYAQAWAALGEAHSALAGAAKIPVEDGYKEARREIEKALALNPDLAEAHALLGLIKMLHDWDFAG